MVVDAAVGPPLARLICHQGEPEFEVEAIVAEFTLGHKVRRAALDHQAPVNDIPLTSILASSLTPHRCVLAVEQDDGALWWLDQLCTLGRSQGRTYGKNKEGQGNMSALSELHCAILLRNTGVIGSTWRFALLWC